MTPIPADVQSRPVSFKAFVDSRRLLLALVALVALVDSPSVAAVQFQVINLVTDDQTAHPAQLTDPLLVNAWGISSSGASPFWVSSNGKAVAEVYRVNPTTNVTTIAAPPAPVNIVGSGTVTGQAFANVAGNFNGDTFLFVTEGGQLVGWRNALSPNSEVLQDNSGANSIYKGAAFTASGGNAYVYAADFRNNRIDVLKGNAGAPSLPGNFTDPGLPAGYAPFNVAKLGNTVFVAYAKVDTITFDEIAGAGLGFVSAFDTNGNFLGRIASQGSLNAPWGLAIAPSTFGEFAGDLLVGNFGDGLISAFDLTAGTFEGLLLDTTGNPLAIDGLWGLLPGNNGNGGSSEKLYFAAGPDDESHGLFGVIVALPGGVPEPATLALLLVGLLALSYMPRSRTSLPSAISC